MVETTTYWKRVISTSKMILFILGQDNRTKKELIQNLSGNDLVESCLEALVSVGLIGRLKGRYYRRVSPCQKHGLRK